MKNKEGFRKKFGNIFRNKKIIFYVLIFLTGFILINVVGIIWTGTQPFWDVDAIDFDNDIEHPDLPYTREISFILLGKKENPITLLHSVICFDNPKAGENLSVLLYFSVEPYSYQFLTNDFIDFDINIGWIEMEVYSSNNLTTEYAISLDNDTHRIRRHSKTFLEYDITIPILWNETDRNRLYVTVGNISLDINKKQYTTVTVSNRSSISVIFDETDFQTGSSYFEYAFVMLYTDFPIHVSNLFDKLVVTLVLLILTFLAALNFAISMVKFLNKKLLKDFLPRIRTEIKEEIDRYKKYSKYGSIWKTISFAILSLAILTFFLGYTWFGKISFKVYGFLIIILFPTPFFITINNEIRKNRIKQKISEEKIPISTTDKYFSIIDNFFIVNIRDILYPFVIIILLFLFIYGSSEFNILWFI